MAEPWFSDPNQFGAWYGALAGGLGGALAGILGAVAGRLAPQGKGRRWVLGGFAAFALFGAANLILGLVALATGQAYAIWYPFLLVGFIFASICGIGFSVVRRQYELAENRRIQAESIRES